MSEEVYALLENLSGINKQSGKKISRINWREYMSYNPM